MKRQMAEYPDDIPMDEFLKRLAVLAAIFVVYLAIQLWISWPAIKWMMGGEL